MMVGDASLRIAASGRSGCHGAVLVSHPYPRLSAVATACLGAAWLLYLL